MTAALLIPRGIAGLAFMPGMEVLLALFGWMASALGFGLWATGGPDAGGMFGLAALALVLRALRLRVAARLW
jgi:hypothetical protein